MKRTKNNSIKKDVAVVIGGSIAGLLSARVLADYFTRVIILEKDKLPQTPQPRRVVPQSVQPHVLFTKGYRILAEFFPGIETKLVANGALSIDWATEFKHFFNGRWGSKGEEASDLISVTCSRYVLEWTIRQELSKLPQLSFLEQSKVARLVCDREQNSITGVCLRSHQTIDADLIVDASGRSSQASQWLEDIECTPAPETVINPFLGYSTRRYKMPRDLILDWKVLLISQTPPDDNRLGYLAKIENDELIATLGGYAKDFPPLDTEGFLEYAKSLAQPDFYNTIALCTPSSPIYAHRATANRLKNYDAIELPQGFIALGDAVCALCPVYGQGMTVSALGAKTLQGWLSKSVGRQLDNNSFQKQLAKNNALHWSLATSQDSRFPTMVGGKNQPNAIERLMAGYANKLIDRSMSEPQLHLLFLEVTHLLRSPLALYNPKVIFKVLTSFGK